MLFLTSPTDQVEDFKPRELLPITDTESDGVYPVIYRTNCHILTLQNIRYCLLTVVIDSFIITVKNHKVHEAITTKPHLDTDKDSAMGFSVFTGGKSPTLSEVSLFINDMNLYSFDVFW